MGVALLLGVIFSIDRSQTTLFVGVTSSPSVSISPSTEPTTELSDRQSISVSDMPSNEPSTTSQTLEPTLIPSTSQAPSFSPTYCATKILNAVQVLDSPLNSLFQSIEHTRIDGKNVLVGARESQTNYTALVFFELNDDGNWVRSPDDFVENHNEKFNIALSAIRYDSILGPSIEDEQYWSGICL